ncbi:AMP-binding protein [Massilia sp. S19_KUP03_FR1]|uniref:AMP-binding protein n=1 Tax=Massilia sp. S19_KUP03_FR1 TaxID=3025503 RepID=UPI002FCD6AEA
MERNPDMVLRDMARHDVTHEAGAMAPITTRLLEHARNMPGQVAYTFLRTDGKVDELTYGQLAQRASGLARYLASQAPQGARMLLLYPAGLEFITAYFACLLGGMIAVPATIPHRLRASRRLQALLADADPALILTRADSATSVKASLALVDAGDKTCLATDTLELPADDDATALPAISSSMTAFLQYTSGSTAQPKGVEVTHANIASNAEAIRVGFGFVPASVMVSWLPLFHDMGLIGSVIAPMYVGFHAVLMAPAAFLKTPVMWLEAITHYRGTCAGAPNFGWDYCARKIDAAARATLDLSSLDVAYNGSEPVRASTLRAFVDAFAPCGMRAEALFPCYGMAETTLFISGGPIERAPLVRTISKSMLEGNQVRDAEPGVDDAREVVSAGVVAAMNQVVIVDPESMRPAGRQRVGEVWVSGPSVARGYWQRPAATEAAFDNYLTDGQGPWLRTGDLGFMQDGELFITGRLKDLVIVNGRNVYPQDIEEVIEATIDFIEPNMCAAFSVEIEGQERLAIVAEANRTLVRAVQQRSRAGASRSEDQAGPKDDVLVKIEANARIICTLIGQQFDVSVSSLVFVKPGTFPRTTSGKVQRSRCKELALTGQLELVYVMPGSIFDRRGKRRQADRDYRAGARPEEAPAASVPANPEAADSRVRADAMIAWLRQYAARRLQSRLGDERRTIAPYVVLDLGNQGFFGLQVPRALGGAGLMTSDLLRVMEQLAAVDLTIATMVGVHNGLGVRPILQAGSPELQQRLLPQLATGRQLAAFALTEPAAGSNPVAMRASAVQVPGGWVVNAEKQWIGLAAWAGVITVFAKAVDAAGHPLGTIALIVAEDTPGLSQGPEALTMGMRGMVQNTVFLTNAFLPDAAVLRTPGEGMDVARDAMLFSRLGIGAMCIGGMKRCAQLMARYAERREIASGRLLDHPVTVARLQDLGAAVFATEALVQAIAAQLDAGNAVAAEAYLACKTAATELFGQAADDLVQMLGGRGYIETNAAPQILRDARVLRILEGPTETLYAHLGATLAQAGSGALAFIGGALRGQALADQLASTVTAIQAAAAGQQLFAATAALHQWLDYRLGELAASVFLLAAAESRAPGQPSLHAVAWARRRFVALGQQIQAELAVPAPYTTSGALLGMVAQYGVEIGDVDQAAPGEGHQLDAMLRAAPLLVPVAAAPVGVEKKPLAAPRSEGGIDAPTPIQAIVHDAVMTWLRSEKRRTQHDIDFDTPFTSIGMDSLATVSIAVDIENRTGLAIVPELLYDYQTVYTLSAYIETRLAVPQAA